MASPTFKVPCTLILTIEVIEVILIWIGYVDVIIHGYHLCFWLSWSWSWGWGSGGSGGL